MGDDTATAALFVVLGGEQRLRYPLNPKYGQPLSLGHWVHWTEKGFKPDEWGRDILSGPNTIAGAEF
jgi:hypothetical protein